MKILAMEIWKNSEYSLYLATSMTINDLGSWEAELKSLSQNLKNSLYVIKEKPKWYNGPMKTLCKNAQPPLSNGELL